MFLNTVNKHLTKELFVANLQYRRSFVVFKKRVLGGGFVGNFETEALARAHLAALGVNPVDYDVSESARHVLIQIDPKSGELLGPLVMDMASTGIMTSKLWNTRIDEVGGGKLDRFASIWKLTTQLQTNNKGSWHTLQLEFAGWANPAMNAALKDNFLAMRDASIKVDDSDE
jgi:hypothetical protein